MLPGCKCPAGEDGSREGLQFELATHYRLAHQDQQQFAQLARSQPPFTAHYRLTPGPATIAQLARSRRL
eukprot:366014-Chlamydomonas_euryale.AAC.3